MNRGTPAQKVPLDGIRLECKQILIVLDEGFWFRLFRLHRTQFIMTKEVTHNACLAERKNLHGYVLSGVVTTRHQLASNAVESVAGSYSRQGICILEKNKKSSVISSCENCHPKGGCSGWLYALETLYCNQRAENSLSLCCSGCAPGLSICFEMESRIK